MECVLILKVRYTLQLETFPQGEMIPNVNYSTERWQGL